MTSLRNGKSVKNNEDGNAMNKQHNVELINAKKKVAELLKKIEEVLEG